MKTKVFLAIATMVSMLGILSLCIIIYENFTCAKIVRDAVYQGDLQTLKDINEGRKYCIKPGKFI